MTPVDESPLPASPYPAMPLDQARAILTQWVNSAVTELTGKGHEAPSGGHSQEGQREEVREVDAAKNCEEEFHARDSYAEKELQKC